MKKTVLLMVLLCIIATYLSIPMISPYIFTGHPYHQYCQSVLNKKKAPKHLLISSSLLSSGINRKMFDEFESCTYLRIAVHEMPSVIEESFKRNKPQNIIIGLTHYEVMNFEYNRLERLVIGATSRLSYFKYIINNLKDGTPIEDVSKEFYKFLSTAIYSPFELFRYAKNIKQENKDHSDFDFQDLKKQQGRFNPLTYFTRGKWIKDNKHPIDNSTFAANVSQGINNHFNKNIYLENIKEVIKLINHHQVNALILLPPTSFLASNRAIPHDVLLEIEKLSKESKFVDFIYFKENYPNHLYYESIHLNEAGANVFSYNLAKKAKELRYPLNLSKKTIKMFNLQNTNSIPLNNKLSSIEIKSRDLFCATRNQLCQDNIRVSTNGKLFYEVPEELKTTRRSFKDIAEFLHLNGEKLNVDKLFNNELKVAYPYASFYPQIKLDKNRLSYHALYFKEQIEYHNVDNNICFEKENKLQLNCLTLFKYNHDIFALDNDKKLRFILKKN